MKKNINQLLSFLLIPAMFFITSCKKDDGEESSGTTEYRVKMTDAPGDFTEVNVDIQRISVHSDATGWAYLPTNAGVYNLLDFANGIDTLLADTILPSGTVSQIRFELGNNNSVVVDGASHPLTVPSGAESGLKLNVHQDLIPGLTYTVLIDFDASMSIVLTGNDEYILKPVLRVVTQGVDGAIKGDIDPDGTFANIYAIMGNDTIGATPDSLGQFIVNGLAPGTYKLIVDPVSPYLPDTTSNVSVSGGVVTDIGVVTLQQ